MWVKCILERRQRQQGNKNSKKEEKRKRIEAKGGEQEEWREREGRGGEERQQRREKADNACLTSRGTDSEFGAERSCSGTGCLRWNAPDHFLPPLLT